MFLCLEEQYWLACRPQVELAAIAEAQRFAGRRLPLKALGEDAFNQALAASYQHDSSAAMRSPRTSAAAWTSPRWPTRSRKPRT